MRFIATADWHLGMAAHNLGDEARPRYQQARIDAVRDIGKLAQRVGAQFVVACGDLFDSNQLNRQLLGRTFEALADYTVPVLLLPGNHDPLDAMSIYLADDFTSRKPKHVHVLTDSVPFSPCPQVEVVGVPWFTKHVRRDLVAEACESVEPAAAGTVRILAAHGAVSSLNPDASDPSTIDDQKLREVISSGLFQVAILGDRHGTYEVSPQIWYPGTPQVTHRREVDAGNVLVVEVDAEGEVLVEKVPVGTWKFLSVAESVSGEQDIEVLLSNLRNLPDKEKTAVWLSLKGTLSTAQFAHLEMQLEELGELFARLDYWERHTDLSVLPDDADFSDLGLGGFAAAALEELIKKASSGAEGAAEAQDALALLYRFAGGKR